MLIPENISPTTSSAIIQESRDIHLERNIIVTDEDLLLYKQLNKEQLIAYDTILDRIFQNKSGAFFIDGPGRTGKTYLYRASLATVLQLPYSLEDELLAHVLNFLSM